MSIFLFFVVVLMCGSLVFMFWGMGASRDDFVDKN